MDIRLRDLRKHQEDLDDFHLCLHCRGVADRHHVEQRSREWVQETLADKHTTEIILRSWALQLEYIADAVQGVLDEFCLFAVVLIEEIDEDLQASTSGLGLGSQLLMKKYLATKISLRDKHLKRKNGCMAEEPNEVRSL